MVKKWIVVITALVLMIGSAGLYVVTQHDYNMVEQAIEIPTPNGKLTGTFVLPKEHTEKVGLVLFIHGDGPINATHDDGYKPLWEKLASIGYASLSLNKRGINGSAGNWLDQSMEERAEEASQAILWAKQQPMIDQERIGVWGASQAGWVIPKLAKKEPLAFSIQVSPAINWLTQGQYYTRSHLAKEGVSEQEIQAQLALDQQIVKLLRRHAPYEEYQQAAQQNKRMTREKWTFVSKNFLSDATEDLHHFRTPLLLLLGEDDIHVDVTETERVYREIIPPELLTVTVFADTEHSMLSTKTAESELRAWLISLFAPRQITVQGYMEQIEAFLLALEKQ